MLQRKFILRFIAQTLFILKRTKKVNVSKDIRVLIVKQLRYGYRYHLVDPPEAFLLACEDGDKEKLREFVNPFLKTISTRNLSDPMEYAIKNNNINAVEWLLCKFKTREIRDMWMRHDYVRIWSDYDLYINLTIKYDKPNIANFMIKYITKININTLISLIKQRWLNIAGNLLFRSKVTIDPVHDHTRLQHLLDCELTEDIRVKLLEYI